MKEQLEIHGSLIAKLQKISSPIAQLLLDLHGMEIEGLPINYLSISTTNPTFISYLNPERCKKIMNEPIYTINRVIYTLKQDCFLYSDSPSTDDTLLNDLLIHYHEDRDFPLRFDKTKEEMGKIQFYTDASIIYKGNIDDSEEAKDAAKNTVRDLYINDSTVIRVWPSNCLGEFQVSCSCNLHLARLFDKYLEDVSFEYFPIEDKDFYQPNVRYHSSIGKLLRKIVPNIGELYTQKDIETFIDLFKRESMKELGESGYYTFEVFTEEKILWAYHEDNYYDGTNTLGGSCMRYSCCQKYLEIYQDNPDKISLAVLLREDKVAARALIWNIDDVLYADRIYSIDKETELLLENKFSDLGIEGVYDTGKSLFVNLEKTYFDYYPYMDTFRYLVLGSGLSTSESVTYDKELTDTHGNVDNCCECCGDDCEEDDLSTVTLGKWEDQVLCSDCGIWTPEDHFIHRGDSVVDYAGDPRYIRRVDELYNGEFADEDDTVMSMEGNCYLNHGFCHTHAIDNHCIKYEGDWYEIGGNYVVEAVDWGYTHIDEAEEIDGDWYHIRSNAYAEIKERLESKESEESEEAPQELLESTESIESTEFKEVTINIPSISGTVFTVSLDINDYPF
jgi:hypothetical protein